jgi:hypothetical protein
LVCVVLLVCVNIGTIEVYRGLKASIVF